MSVVTEQILPIIVVFLLLTFGLFFDALVRNGVRG